MTSTSTHTGQSAQDDRNREIIHSVMDEFERRNGPGRRDGDIAGHFRAADEGIRMGRGWLEIVIMLVGFGVMIGTQLAQTAAQREAFNEFKAEIRQSMNNVSTVAQSASGAAHDLAIKVEAIENWKRDREKDDKDRDFLVSRHDSWITAQKELQAGRQK